MRFYRSGQRAHVLIVAVTGAVLTGAVLGAVLGAAAPAVAEVRVSPTTAVQGTGVNLTLTVTNDHKSAAITRLRLILPPELPVAEVYPLSVQHWAPQITTRPLNSPMPGLHGGSPLTETTAGILWSATAGNALHPGASAKLMVAMGPIPRSARLRLTMQPTYADGSTSPALPPVVLALTPPAAGPGDVGHGGATPGSAATGGQARDGQALDGQAQHGGPAAPSVGGTNVAAVPEVGVSSWGVAGWLVALLIGILATVAVRRPRPGTAPVPLDPVAAAKASGLPATAAAKASALTATAAGEERESPGRTRVTRWTYRDRAR